MSEDQRVDQGGIVLNDGECKREVTPAFYPSPEPEPANPEEDTRIDLVTGKVEPIRKLE